MFDRRQQANRPATIRPLQPKETGMKAAPSALQLLALPPLAQKICRYLLREGAVDLATLATALATDPVAIQTEVDALAASRRVRLTPGGEIELVLGHTRRRTLPARLWPALGAADRLYSAQEIVALRTIIPILQFARARLGEFTDHGPGHVLRVKLLATQLGSIFGLTTREQQLLRAAALFHDVGNVIERERHHIISQETVERLAANGQLPFSQREATLVALLCRWHRKEYDPNRCDEIQGEAIRTGLLASILRVADALDSDYRRVDYGAKLMWVLEFFFPHELDFWNGLTEILGFRLSCAPELHLQAFFQPQANVEKNYYIPALYKDINSTPLHCIVDIIKCGVQEMGDWSQSPAVDHPAQSPVALLVSLIDPHSLVMAAISRRQLLTAGYRVELLVYPDTAGATAWLWGEALSDFTPAHFAQLVLIGDRPDAALQPTIVNTLAQWRAAGVGCTVLNRHEANWSRLPALLELGVTVKLGGDWAYFWGDEMDEVIFFWGKIASLCTRDPIQSTVGLTAEEEAITQGVRKAIYDLVRQSPTDLADWAALVTPFLDQIAADERGWFAAQAPEFVRTYANLGERGQITGQVLTFDRLEGQEPYAIFWGLEQAIERNGRRPERGIRFNTPYAIATWADPGAAPDAEGAAVELLAISHWREEEATPIRLLYPTELGPPPEGNESAIRVRLPAAQSTAVIQALLAACNQPSI
jgi:hypothetical protein